jgi:hypothetical protein
MGTAMRNARYFVAAVLAALGAAGTFFGLRNSGLTGEGGVAGGIYAGLVIYPAAVLVFVIVFWIVYAAMDPGSEK